MNTNLAEIENRLWSAADELRANSRLRASEYSTPVLGLIFLRYADHKFTQTEQEIISETSTSRRKRTDPRTQYQARGVFYLPENARFQYLLSLPESENIGQAITDAMKAIEEENPQVDGVLPKTYSSLSESGRAGFVMANSAADARASELEVRSQIIKSGAVDVVVSIASNFFYTVTLPCTLWFFDRSKQDSDRHDKVLFIDTRHLYQQVSRAHREFTPLQLEFLANIVRLYRGEAPEDQHNSADFLATRFPDTEYVDVPGLCKVATIAEIETQGWSLNPGRYVGVAEQAPDDFDFAERFGELNEELEILNAEAHQLEERIAENVARILENRV